MKFQIAGGSVAGTEHTKPGQPGSTNNQDAFYWKETDRSLVALVCDGCSNGGAAHQHSEVGALLGVRWLVQLLSEAADSFVTKLDEKPDAPISFDWVRTQQFALSQMSLTAKAMGGSFADTIERYFLFTMVGAVITPKTTFLFSVGDGVFVLNGEVITLGPFPENRPPYLAYNLTNVLSSDSNPNRFSIKINRTIPTSQVKDLIIGTDGVIDLIGIAQKKLPHREDLVGDITQFTAPNYFTNPDAIRRRLNIINKEGAEVVDGGRARVTAGLLHDDTTLIAIRPAPTQPKPTEI